MADRRKRGAPVGLMSSPRPRAALPTLQSFIGHNCCIWFVVVVLLVSAALRRVLVTNSLLPLQSFIGHNYCIWYVVVVLLVSATLRSPWDRLPFTIHSNRSLDTTAVIVVLLVICTYVASLRPTLFGHNCCIWYVVVVLLASAALRSV